MCFNIWYLFFSFWLTPLCMTGSRFIHIATLIQFHSFFYGWVIIFHCIYIYHTFFIYSSVGRHLGYLHVLAIVNSAAMNTGVHVSFELWFSQGICPVVRFLGCLVVLPLVFWGTSILFCTVAKPIYSPTNSVRGNPFLHTLSSIYCLHIFLWWSFWLVWGDTSL